MSESLVSPSEKAGLPPGSMVHVGEAPHHETRISVLDYSKNTIDEAQINALEELEKYRDRDTITWVNVEGLNDAGLIGEMGAMFDIHPLVIEDILNTHQRAKFEEYDHYLFIVIKSLLTQTGTFNVQAEQVSILILNNFVFTFKEKHDALLTPVEQRIKTSKGRFRSLGADYLAYAILDIIIDNLFVLVDYLDDETGILEDRLVAKEPKRETLHSIQRLKRDLIHIRRNVSPIRELLAAMLRSESPLISDKTGIYLRDVLDHAVRIVESIESYRDILSSLLEIYVSSISNKMNEIMMVLTVFASIFIPLTFLTGIYGMNFEFMPELKWRWAYPALWLAFIAIPVVLLLYFRKKKWL